MSAPFIRRLHLDGFLSFAPGTEPFGLSSLNVLIGPNGSGKTNVIEAMELLRATPSDLAAATLVGREPLECQWKGDAPQPPANVEAELDHCSATGRPLCYRLEFAAAQTKLQVRDEAIDEVATRQGNKDVPFYYNTASR
jgi:predicted ATPase